MYNLTVLNCRIIAKYSFLFNKERLSVAILSLKLRLGCAAAHHRFLIRILQLWRLGRFIACSQHLKTFIKQASVPSSQNHWIFTFFRFLCKPFNKAVTFPSCTTKLLLIKWSYIRSDFAKFADFLVGFLTCWWKKTMLISESQCICFLFCLICGLVIILSGSSVYKWLNICSLEPFSIVKKKKKSSSGHWVCLKRSQRLKELQFVFAHKVVQFVCSWFTKKEVLNQFAFFTY